MPHPKSPHAYEDIRRALDLALANRGARRVCASASDATQWRHRANRFRNALRQEVEGVLTPTAYDILVMRIRPEEPHVVVIELNVDAGAMETLDGQPIAVDRTAGVDALVEEATELAKSLGIEL